MQSINSIETCGYGTSKYLVTEKERLNVGIQENDAKND